MTSSKRIHAVGLDISFAVRAFLLVLIGFLGQITSGHAATFTVANTNDSGPGSLRDAVEQANADTSPGANTVNFASGMSGKITLTSGRIQIARAMSIVGPGAGSLTLDGNANDRIFAVFVTAPACPAVDNGGVDYLVNISGLTLTNAQRSSTAAGGAIYSEHSLNLDSVIVRNSAAALGGGLMFSIQYPNQALTINNAQFFNNLAKPISALPSFSHWGGAVYIAERCGSLPTTAPVAVNITNSLFSGNRVQPVGLNGFGGAIGIWSRADVSISGSRIVDNHIDVPNPPVANKFYHGGGIYGTSKSLNIRGSEISFNSVIDVTASNQTRGGGVGYYNEDPALQSAGTASALQISNSTISNNGVAATGGGVFVYGNVAAELVNSTLTGNVAASGRTGGVVLFAGATNPASSGNTSAPSLRVISSIVAKNTSGTADIATNSPTIPSLTLNASNSLLGNICSACNISVVGSGNVLNVDPLLGPLAFNGGAGGQRTHALLPGSPTINTGSNSLSLLYDQRGFNRVVNGVADMGAFELGPVFTVTNTNDSGPGSLRDAVARANADATLGINTVVASGLSGTITLTSGQIQISRAMSIVGPGPSSLTIDGNANGRIFSVFTTSPTCPAVDNNGADYFVSISGLALTNAQRSSTTSGGAIYSEHSLNLDSVIVKNSAAAMGGGLMFAIQYPNQALTINNSQFLNNLAKPLSSLPNSHWGGALLVADRCGAVPTTVPVAVNIANSSFSGNRVQPVGLNGFGGAIGTWSRADIYITGSRIVDNHIDAPNPPAPNKSYRGGGIFGTSKSLSIRGSEISFNSVIDVTASDQTRAGGINYYNEDPALQSAGTASALQIWNSTISNNSVGATGGGVLVYGNVATELVNSTLTRNVSAAGRTGGMLLSAGVTNPASSGNTSTPSLKVISSIVAKNTDGTADISTSSSTIPTFALNASNSLLGNICSACNISVVGSGNVLNADPLLGPLAFNGGPTRTHALLTGSPAIDTGSNSLGLFYDQRAGGFPRVVNGVADMGAFEFSLAGQSALTVLAPTSMAYGTTAQLTSIGGSGTGAVTFSAVGSNGCAVSGSTLSVTNASGSCSVTANKAADANNGASVSPTAPVFLRKASQSIGPIGFTPTTLAVSGTTAASATATSGLAPAFSSTVTPTICSVSGNTVTGLLTGTCTVTATQAGNSNYLAAVPVTQNITVSAAPVPGVSLSPNSLDFGLQNVGTTSTTKNSTLTNTGSAPLVIASVSTTGDFAVTHNCGSTLAVGNSCNLAVTFTPTTGSVRAGKTSLISNAAGSPHDVTLSGTGDAANAPICSLSATPATVRKNGTSTLTASCSPAAASYAWTGGSCAGTTASTCVVTPAATTTYSVTGSNSFGSSTASTVVRVNSADITPILMLLLD